MSHLLCLLLLVPLLPLAGVLLNRGAVAALSAIGILLLTVLAIAVDDDHLCWIVVAQAPFLAAAAVAALRVLGRDAAVPDEEENRAALERLKERHAALKAEVARGEKEESQSLQIYGVAKALAEALSWKDMAPRLTAGIQKLFGAYEFLLYTIDEKGWTLLHRRGSWSKEPPLQKDLPSETAFFHPPRVLEVVPVLTVPIYLTRPEGKQMNGVLFLKSAKDGRTEDELRETGNDVGQQLGIAINKARLFAEMEKHSRVDGLTGALRRQAFMDRLAEEFKRASVFHTPFSVMMVDIDFFKSVNDSHGHAGGDAVLTRVGTVLKECFYETDVVGRYGGEEFVILLPRADAAGVMRKAESLRQRLEKEKIVFGFETLKITVSVGVAHYPEAGRTAEDLIGKADAALYRAKETGRNKVVAA